jgi:hypothetical protein
MRNTEIPKQAHQQRLHFGVSQTRKSKIKGTLTFEVANPEIPKGIIASLENMKGKTPKSRQPSISVGYVNCPNSSKICDHEFYNDGVTMT